jgi:POT family proton-dependent oligopeptide transporter
MMLDLPPPAAAETPSWSDKFHPAAPWLERRKRDLGIAAEAPAPRTAAVLTRTAFAGGQTRLHGAAYFRFFTWLMLGTAVAFVPYALLYRPKTYLQD